MRTLVVMLLFFVVAVSPTEAARKKQRAARPEPRKVEAPHVHGRGLYDVGVGLLLLAVTGALAHASSAVAAQFPYTPRTLAEV